MTGSVSRRSSASTGTTSRTSSSPTQWRSAAIGQREPGIDAARRGRLPLHRRPVGHPLQDRRPLRRYRPHRLAHGSQAVETSLLEPRRGAVRQLRDLGRELSRARDRHRQGDRQGRVGDQRLRRPGGSLDHRRAAAGEGQDHRRRRRRRPRRARLHRGARCQDRQDALAQIRDPGAGRAGQRNLEGQGPEGLADRRRRDVGHRHLRSRLEPGDLGHRQSGADVRPDLSARR